MKQLVNWPAESSSSGLHGTLIMLSWDLEGLAYCLMPPIFGPFPVSLPYQLGICKIVLQNVSPNCDCRSGFRGRLSSLVLEPVVLKMTRTGGDSGCSKILICSRSAFTKYSMECNHGAHTRGLLTGRMRCLQQELFIQQGLLQAPGGGTCSPRWHRRLGP